VHFGQMIGVLAVHGNDAHHRLAVLFKLGERAFDGGQFRTDVVGGAGENSG